MMIDDQGDRFVCHSPNPPKFSLLATAQALPFQLTRLVEKSRVDKARILTKKTVLVIKAAQDLPIPPHFSLLAAVTAQALPYCRPGSPF
jgi:hypothetical protein